MNPTRYRGGQGANTVNVGDGPSPYIWADCPWNDIQNGHRAGVAHHWDFANGPLVAAGAEAAAGIFKGFASTGGGGTLDTTNPGIAFASDGDNEGASIAAIGPNIKLARSLGKVWWEMMINTSTIADTKHGFFAGLVGNPTLSATVPIAAAGTLADLNLVGFHRLEGDGDQLDAVYKADGVTQVNVQTDALAQIPSAMGASYQALVAGSDIKIGGWLDMSTFDYVYFAHGTPVATKAWPADSVAGTDVPNDAFLQLCFAVLNATASTPGSTTLRWWRVAQLF